MCSSSSSSCSSSGSSSSSSNKRRCRRGTRYEVAVGSGQAIIFTKSQLDPQDEADPKKEAEMRKVEHDILKAK